MIGDQLDRDIRFAHEAGLQTILVAGRFHPKWIEAADATHADAVAQDYLEAVRWALRSKPS
jgi:ribonucleotide monophosphatase NagD (HAD superfamily)